MYAFKNEKKDKKRRAFPFLQKKLVEGGGGGQLLEREPKHLLREFEVSYSISYTKLKNQIFHEVICC